MSDSPHNGAEVPEPFEFGEEDNQLFSQLSVRMRLVGIALLTWGVLLFPRIFAGGDLGAMVLSLGLLATGVWTIRSAHRFGAIAQTQGTDIAHLMSALKSMHHLYTLIAGVIGVIVVWIVVALVFALVVSLGWIPA